MKHPERILLICLMLGFLVPQSFAQHKKMYHKKWTDFNKNGKKDIYEDPSQPVNARIDDLLKQMTLEEKTCQMATLYGFRRVLQDELPTPNWKNEIWKDGIGNIDEHINNVAYHPKSQSKLAYPHSLHAETINKVQRFFVEETRLGIPVDFTNEGIRGLCHDKATGFPSQLGVGSTWDTTLVRQIGEITAREGRALGYTNIYSPILDLPRDPRWGRIVECYGESPYLVSELGRTMVRSLQANGVVSTPKHFAVYSNPKGGRDAESRTDPHVARREMETLYLAPFKAGIKDGGALGVMSSYNDYDGIPVSASSFFLTEILRKQWGFQGYVVSDSHAVGYIHDKHQVAPTYKEAVRQTVMAGLNIRTNFTKPEVYINPLRELVKDGALSMDVIDSRVKDVLRVKFWLGLFDSPYVENPEAADKLVRNAKHQHISLKAAHECMVLLKNDANTLPLDKSKISNILVTGPLATSFNYAISRYGPSNLSPVTVLKGIENKSNGSFKVHYAPGCKLIDENYPESEIMDFPVSEVEAASIDSAVQMAQKNDVIVAVLGEDETLVGEGRTRTNLNLPGNQLVLLKALHSTGKPVVVVLINGRPLTINWTNKHIPAIVEAWFPGENGGTAVADILFGDYNPGGKIPNTFPKTVGQVPYNFPYKKGSQNPTARWNWLKQGTMVDGPLYPFGYGLSYTTFEYSNLKLSSKTIGNTDTLTLSFEITNTGKLAGDEIPQLYLTDVYSSVVTYTSILKGFRRMHLKPGEKSKVSFTLTPNKLAILDKNMKWTVEPGTFKIAIGSSSTDIRLKDEFEVVE